MRSPKPGQLGWPRSHGEASPKPPGSEALYMTESRQNVQEEKLSLTVFSQINTRELSHTCASGSW